MNDCQEWPLGRTAAGYGTCKGDDRPKSRAYVHRVVWEQFHGPIPSGLYICHRCDNPPCVNPDHLFLARPKDNTADMIRKGRDRMPAALNRKKTHCKQGHPFDAVHAGSGQRICRMCQRAYNKAYHAAHPRKQRAYVS